MAHKKLNVLIIRNAYEQDCGGAEQYALNLCVELKKQDIYPVLMTQVPDLILKARNANITVLRGRWHKSQKWGKHYFIRFPLMVLWYVYIILRYKFDVIHPQGRDDFIFASTAGWLLRKRVVWTDHADLKYILNLSIHPFPYLRQWTIWSARYAHKIICVSKSEYLFIKELLPDHLSEKLEIIHNGVNYTPPKKIIRRPSSTLLVANSRLVPDKGISELLQAAALAKGRPHIWIVGGYSGNKTKYIKEAKKLGIISRLRLLGYVSEPNNYVAAADIFLHASYHEAFSLAIIEAASLGKPIIATNVGGAPEIIDDRCGILIPPRDVKALVGAVNLLINNKGLAIKYGRAAAEKAKKEFNFSKIVKERIIPLYK